MMMRPKTIGSPSRADVQLRRRPMLSVGSSQAHRGSVPDGTEVWPLDSVAGGVFDERDHQPAELSLSGDDSSSVVDGLSSGPDASLTTRLSLAAPSFATGTRQPNGLNQDTTRPMPCLSRPQNPRWCSPCGSFATSAVTALDGASATTV